MSKLSIVLRALSATESSALQTWAKDSQNRVLVEAPSFINSEDRDWFDVIEVDHNALGQSMEQCFNDIVAFGHKPIGKQTYLSHLGPEGDKWWYYSRMKVYNDSKELYAKSTVLAAALNQAAVDETVNADVYYDQKELAHLSRHPHLTFISSAKEKQSPWRALLMHALVFAIRFLLGITQLWTLTRKRKHALIHLQYHEQPIIDLKTGKMKQGNPVYEYLMERCQSDPSVIFLSFMPVIIFNKPKSLNLRENLWSKKYAGQIINFELFMGLILINPINWIRIFQFREEMQRKLAAIDPILSEGCDRLIHGKIKGALNMLMLGYYREKAARLFLKWYKPISVGGLEDLTMLVRPVFNPAKQLGVKTWGIQHGGINKYNMTFMYREADVPFAPWPDYTILRGKKTFDQLAENSSYPTSCLKILGHLRTDCIPILSRLGKQDVIAELDPHKPLVHFATQPFRAGDISLRDALVEDFFAMAGRHPEYQYVIKPHPVEKDLDIYREAAQRHGVKHFSIYTDDLYRLLAVSDVVLTYFSTVGTEAVYFRKNLVVMDYYGRDAAGYIADGVGFEVKNGQELEKTVLAILEDKLSITAERRDQFIEHRAFKVDGNTTDRFYEFMKSLEA